MPGSQNRLERAKKARTPGGSAITELILEVFRTNGAFIAAGDRFTRDLGLTAARWQVLGVLELETTATVAQIARRQGLQRQSVQRLVDALAAENIVELIDNPDHRRAKLVRMTASGLEIYSTLLVRQVRWVNNLATGLSEEAAEAARVTLQALRTKLEIQVAPDARARQAG